jgi:opacity protein-like surface antigen
MRKVLVLLAAGTALAAAAPAAAQYYPQPQPYGYNGYNQHGYNGYGNNFGQVRALQVRIDALQNQIRRLDRRDAIRDGSADRLREESRNIEQRLNRAERYGLNGYEANDIQARIARLEQRVQYALASRYGRYGNGYNGYGHDGYDRDGDRDRDRDGDRDRD